MRTLSRPMFNMGGPIKQGIMHGIREPMQVDSSCDRDQGDQGTQEKIFGQSSQLNTILKILHLLKNFCKESILFQLKNLKSSNQCSKGSASNKRHWKL